MPEDNFVNIHVEDRAALLVKRPDGFGRRSGRVRECGNLPDDRLWWLSG